MKTSTFYLESVKSVVSQLSSLPSLTVASLTLTACSDSTLYVCFSFLILQLMLWLLLLALALTTWHDVLFLCRSRISRTMGLRLYCRRAPSLIETADCCCSCCCFSYMKSERRCLERDPSKFSAHAKEPAKLPLHNNMGFLKMSGA